jgi:hypothetical protein
MPSTRATDSSAPARITQGELTELLETVSDLRSRLDAHGAATPSSHTVDPSRSKVRGPDPFDGKDPTGLRKFLLQLQLNFETYPNQFPDDKSKVVYAASHLQGRPLDWFHAYFVADDPHPILSDFARFTAELQLVFGETERFTTVGHRLCSLKQTGSIVSYLTEFRQLSTRIKLCELSLVILFHEGLQDSVKDELAKVELPDRLEPFIQLAVSISNRLRDRAQQRGLPVKPLLPRKNYPSAALTQPRAVLPASKDPIDAAPATAAPRSKDPNTARRAPRSLTEEEKAYRRKNNLCLYCGDGRHALRDCPTAPKWRPRPARSFEAMLVPGDDEEYPQGNEPAQLQ